MKIRQAIEQLQQIEKGHGDIPVSICTSPRNEPLVRTVAGALYFCSDPEGNDPNACFYSMYSISPE